MAGKTNTSATFFAQKKLLGKAHTSNLKTDGEELIGSNIQTATSLVFGEKIPLAPERTLYLLQSASNDDNATVEYIQFNLDVLTGTTYDANNTNPDGGAGSDPGESSQVSGPHTYKFRFPSDYTSSTSNPRAGNGFFNNNKLVHETLGAVQLVPPFFSQAAPNPYIVKIYQDDGGGGVGTEIPLLDNIDWNVDFYNGILFLQDYNASKIPAFARAFAYVGKMAEEVIASGSGNSGGGGSSSVSINRSKSLFDIDTRLTKGAAYTATGVNFSQSNHNTDLIDVFVNGQLLLSGSESDRASNNVDYTISGNNNITFSFDLEPDDRLTILTVSTGSETSVYNDAVTFNAGLSGSLTRLADGSSYLVAGNGITITTASNGSIEIASGDSANYVFNEYVGQGDGTNTLFTLDNTPTANRNVSIYVNGLLQMPATSITSAPFQDYSVTGSTIYFVTSSLPLEGSIVMANYTTNDSV